MILEIPVEYTNGQVEAVSVSKKIGEPLAWTILTQPIIRVWVDRRLAKGTILFANPFEYPKQSNTGRCFYVSADVWARWSMKYEADTGRPITTLPLQVYHVSAGS